MKLLSFNKKNIYWLLFAGFILRIALSFFGTLELDFNTFVAWSNMLKDQGFSTFYNGWSDYLPGYLYILWFIAKVKTFAVFVPNSLLYKLPAIIADIATSFLIYKIVSKSKKEKLALIAASFYLFNPAVIVNSTLWGQVDSLTALFSILSIYLLDISPLFSALALGYGAIIKPQVALAALVVFYLMIAKRWKVLKIAKYIIVSFLVFVISFIPFSSFQFLPDFIIQRLSTTLNQYPYTSVNAFNLWGLFGFWNSESGLPISPMIVGVFLTLLAFLVIVQKRNINEKYKGYILLAVLFVSNFLFFSRMHERHLLPALAPLLITSAYLPFLRLHYIGFSITYVINIYYSFVWITHDFEKVIPEFLVKLVIAANILIFISFMKEIIVPRVKKFKLKNLAGFIDRFIPPGSKKDVLVFPKISLGVKNARLILALILGFSLITRLINITNPKDMYFDEVYHAFTAKIMLEGDPKAWEWWNPHPEGFAYEWTHPPLAKEGMVVGMAVFGQNSFGWRFPGVLLGVGSVYLIFLLSRHIFKDESLSLLSAAIFALDGLPLVMSRIGMNDSYLLFFILLSLYLYLKDKHFFSAISFGLAAASKWSAIWAVPIFIVSHFVFKKKIKITYNFYLIIPPLIYIASYIPMFLTGHDFQTFIDVQKQMWWYHTGLDATHPFTSFWYTWPFLVRPIWLYTSGVVGNKISNIYAMGNPGVFWFGFVSVLISFYYFIKTRNKKIGFIVFSYMVFFVPWAFSPRIMFLYHYLPSLPFLAIASGFLLRKFPKLIKPFIVICVILFLYFYPRFTGISISPSLNETYRWFSGW